MADVRVVVEPALRVLAITRSGRKRRIWRVMSQRTRGRLEVAIGILKVDDVGYGEDVGSGSLLGTPGRRQLLRRDGRVPVPSHRQWSHIATRAPARTSSAIVGPRQLGIVRMADHHEDALKRLDQLVALEGAHALMLAR